jgi:hypothetical protein
MLLGPTLNWSVIFQMLDWVQERFSLVHLVLHMSHYQASGIILQILSHSNSELDVKSYIAHSRFL